MPVEFQPSSNKITSNAKNLFKKPWFIVAAIAAAGLGIYAYKKQADAGGISPGYTDQVAAQYPSYTSGIDPYQLDLARIQAGTDVSAIQAQKETAMATTTSDTSLGLAQIQLGMAQVQADIAKANIEAGAPFAEAVKAQQDSINAVKSQVDLILTKQSNVVPSTPAPVSQASGKYTVSIPSDLANYAKVKAQMEKSTGFKFYADPATGKLTTTATQTSLNKIIASSPYKVYYKAV